MTVCLIVEGTERKCEQHVLLACKELAETNVVRHGSGGDAKPTTSLVNHDLSRETARRKDGECGGEEGEKSDEGNALAQGDDCEKEGEDEPSYEIDAERACELIGSVSVGGANTRTRNEDSREGHPESTIGSESGSTEHVTAGELPHACEELSETTAEDGHSDYEVGCGDAPSSNVVEGEDECGRRKREQTQRRGVAYSAGRALNGRERVSCFFHIHC
jgi:hypothetical protein